MKIKELQFAQGLVEAAVAELKRADQWLQDDRCIMDTEQDRLEMAATRSALAEVLRRTRTIKSRLEIREKAHMERDV